MAIDIKNQYLLRDSALQFPELRDEICLDMSLRGQDDFLVPFRMNAFGAQIPLIESVVMQAGIVCNNKSTNNILSEVFQNKKIVELGCRSGDFLKYLQLYGADVIGSTDADRAETVRAYLSREIPAGTRPEIYSATSENAWREIGYCFPDLLFSYNLFAPSRWKNSSKDEIAKSFDNLIISITTISSSDTVCHLQPYGEGVNSPNEAPVSYKHFLDMQKRGRIKNLHIYSQTLSGAKRDHSDVTYSFQIP